MSETTAEKVYRAMQGQKRAVKCCELMLAAVNNYRDKEIISSIRREERRHYYLLEGIYEEMAGKECKLPPIPVTMPKQLREMLRAALCDKILAIEHYEALQQEMTCARNRDILEMILCDQKEHAQLLAALYQRI